MLLELYTSSTLIVLLVLAPLPCVTRVGVVGVLACGRLCECANMSGGRAAAGCAHGVRELMMTKTNLFFARKCAKAQP
eukprot:12913104-Prorocentrum_lima.AAC.1